jgi:hypothetical protein
MLTEAQHPAKNNVHSKEGDKTQTVPRDSGKSEQKVSKGQTQSLQAPKKNHYSSTSEGSAQLAMEASN